MFQKCYLILRLFRVMKVLKYSVAFRDLYSSSLKNIIPFCDFSEFSSKSIISFCDFSGTFIFSLKVLYDPASFRDSLQKVLSHSATFRVPSYFLLKVLYILRLFRILKKCYLFLRLFGGFISFSSESVIWNCDFSGFHQKVLSDSVSLRGAFKMLSFS